MINGYQVLFNPLGLATPDTIKLKLLRKNTSSLGSNFGWDSPLSSKLIKEWTKVMEEGISKEDL